MNLLTKDKYRTKIMEHLLHQSSTEQQNSIQSPQKHQSPFKNQQDGNNFTQVFSKSMFFEKASNQKPLIYDGQQTERQRQNKSNNQKFINFTKSRENHSKNQQNNPNFRNFCQDSNRKMNQNMPQIRMKGHLKKQSYIFHQKLPIMEVSKTSDNKILQKLKKNIKVKQSYPDKQNIPQNYMSNTKKEIQNQKKYRFVVPNKVNEALNLRKTARENDLKQQNLQLNKTQVKKQIKIEENLIDQTKRSKGSKQMLDFLQSAREKLFENMNKTDQNKQVISQTLDSTPNPKDQIKEIKNHTIEQNENHNFKIQIEVSQNKTIQIQLSLHSDAKKVAQNFIQSNKSQLSSFNSDQIQKLETLLSHKISLQVQKQKKIFEQKKQKVKHEKFNKIIDHKGVNEVLLKNIQSVKKDSNKKTQRNVSLNKNKRLQFSHVYLENIDAPVINQQESGSQNQKVTLSDGQNLNIKKIVSLNPNEEKSILNYSQSREVKLGGYLNSPHQLITYRLQSPLVQTANQKQSFENIDEKQQVNVSHFPLSTQFYELTNCNNFQAKNQKQLTQKQNQKDQNDVQQIGAAKILSKSRSKLFRKKSLQKLHNNLQVQDNQQITCSKDQQTKIPLSDHQIPNKIVEQKPEIKSHPAINTISSQIVAKLGKQNIMNSLKEKQITKRQKIIKQRQQKILQQIKQCSFKPKINNLSKSIDQNKKKKVKIIDILQNVTQNSRPQKNINQLAKTLQTHQQNENKENSSFNKILSKLQKPQPRFQELYENHKTIQQKKQYIRQKSLQQISFKPQINKISKKIIETKRNSLNNSICQEYNTLANSSKSLNRHQSTCKKPSKRNSVQFQTCNQNLESTYLTRKRKSLNISRNVEGLQIGEYLYKQAMKMKKKKETLKNAKIESFKPLDKSDKIMINLRQRRLSQYFDELVGIQDYQNEDQQNYDFIISSSSFDLSELKFSKSPLKYLVPLLEELKELEVSLTREEFIESGMKLVNFLSQDEKADFLGMKRNQNRGAQKPVAQPCLNKLSLELIEMKQDYIQDIYHRGLQYKRQIQEKVQYDMENKVRRELQKCTFKPQINMSLYRFSK